MPSIPARRASKPVFDMPARNCGIYRHATDEILRHQASGRRTGGGTTGLTEAAPSATRSLAGHNEGRSQTQSRCRGTASPQTPFNPGMVQLKDRVSCAQRRRCFMPKIQLGVEIKIV